jgi:ABC-type Mn2+/Zn2+ transport system permease subunit
MKMREGQRDEYTKGQSRLPVAQASPSGLGLRIEDSPCQASFLSAALIALLCLFVCPSPAQTTKATEQADQVTQDLLKEIGTAPTSQAATSAERSAGEYHSNQEEGISWPRLIGLFSIMLVTAAAVGMSGAVLGLFVLLRREALVALAIPQVVAIGAAIGMRLGWPTLPPALGVAMVALIYFALSKRWNAGNWVVPSFYVAGLCLSFLIIANRGQDVEDLQGLFTGVDVAVKGNVAAVAVPVLLAVGVACAILWRRWLLLAQAPAAAELAGLRPARWDTLFLLLLTIVILLGTNSLGVVMVLSMLFLPAATVLPWVKRIPAAMAGGALLSLVFLAIGFYLSNKMNWPMSQSVGGAGFVVLAVSQLAAQLKG